MSNPVAVVTVQFPRPVTGSELIGAMRAITANATEQTFDPRFYHEKHFDNGDTYFIGQHSGYPYDHAIVVPTRDSEYIRPDDTYSKVEVMSTSWPGNTYMVGYDNDSIVESIRKLADKLTSYFANASATTRASIWPQEIEVCVECDKIVTHRYDNRLGRSIASCQNHGRDVVTKKVRVTLA